MRNSQAWKAVLLLATMMVAAGHGMADDDAGTLSPDKPDRVFAAKPYYSPYAGRNFPTRPLELFVVTDHSDNMELFKDLLAGKPEMIADPQARSWYDMIKGGQVLPFKSGKPLGSDNPHDLGTWMQAYEHRTGGNVLAIAHSGKLSNGRYGRVIEIHTPRWTAHDAKRFGVKLLEGTKMTVTERAYTSPIWYTP